jgi:hypothetical protein
MHRSRRPLWLRLLEGPLRLLFMLVAFIIQVIVVVRRFIPAPLLLLLIALVPVLAFARSRLDDFGGWLMIVAALVLAFAAGALFQRR